MDTPVQEIGIAGVAAMTVFFAASLIAAGVIWLMTTQPESFAMLATADNVWSFMAGLAARLLAVVWT